MEKSEKYSVYQIIFLILHFILHRIFHYLVVFVRMTVYWIVKLIYKIFRLREIDVARQKNILEGLDTSVNIKHEFTFPKSEKFITTWIYIRDLVFTLDLEEDEKSELFDFLLILVAEAERGAFNLTKDYLSTKDLKEPGFEDMCIQGIFSTKSDIDVRDRFENPMKENEGMRLRNKRKREESKNWTESKGRGIY